jgi:hypothetical protein
LPLSMAFVFLLYFLFLSFLSLPFDFETLTLQFMTHLHTEGNRAKAYDATTRANRD